MADEFTPTTEQVRRAFTDHEWDEFADNDSSPEVRRGMAVAGEAFDRWLAGGVSAAERRGAAKALRALADEADAEGSAFLGFDVVTVRAQGLRHFADEYESGEREL